MNNFKNQLAVPNGPKNIDELWRVFKESLTSAKKVLLTKHTKYEKDWVSEEIRQLVIEKADFYQKIMQHKQKNQSVPLFLKPQYVIIKRKCKKACKLALNSWWEQKSKETEDDYEMSLKQGKGGFLIKNLKSITKSRGYRCLKILTKDGTTRLTTTKSKLKRWCEHFKEVTNINTLVNHYALSHLPQCLPPSDSSLYPMTEPLTNEELCRTQTV